MPLQRTMFSGPLPSGPPSSREFVPDRAMFGLAAGREPAEAARVEPPSRRDPFPGEDLAPDRPGGGRPEPSRGVFAEFGPLAPLVADPEITDIFINGPGHLFVDRSHGPEPCPDPGLDERSIRALAVRLVAAGGRHVDEATPCVDVRLRSGIRVHVVLPPVSTGGTTISIRLPRVHDITVDALEQSGYFPGCTGKVVRRLVESRRNLLVTGAAGSGKTTTLRALLALADPSERIVVIEDVAELRVRHPHVVSLEARQANLEGAGEIGLSRLVREALRMRPDRLVVGEVRGAEVRDLLAALNTGHDGGAGTLHANSLADVPARFEALGALAGLTPDALARQAVSAIDAVLHVERRPEGYRLAALGRLELDPLGRLRAVDGSDGAGWE